MAGGGRCCTHDRARHGLAQLLVPLDVVLPQRVFEATCDGVLAEVEQQLQELVAAAVAAVDREASAGQTLRLPGKAHTPQQSTHYMVKS